MKVIPKKLGYVCLSCRTKWFRFYDRDTIQLCPVCKSSKNVIGDKNPLADGDFKIVKRHK